MTNALTGLEEKLMKILPDELVGKVTKYAQVIKSTTAIRLGINNEVKACASRGYTAEQVLDNIKQAVVVYEYLLYYFGAKLVLNSFYRCPELNKAVGGSDDSHHMAGFAFDFYLQGYSMSAAFKEIKKALELGGIKWDKLINEYDGWLHISFNTLKRMQLLHCYRKNGKTVWENVK